MGSTLSFVAWAIPMTVFSIYRRNLGSQGEDDTDLNAHRHNPAFDRLYPPPSSKKLKTSSQVHSKSYMEYTQNGRTSHYPVDPFFKGLKATAKKIPIPRFDLETVFEESKFFEDSLNQRFKSTQAEPTQTIVKAESDHLEVNTDDDALFVDAECGVDVLFDSVCQPVHRKLT